MNRLLCPSMMCADFESLEKEVKALEQANIDTYHIDIMDGSYVPNFGMGLQDLEYIRKATDRIIDVHLMIQNPSNHIEMFAKKGANIIYFHPDAEINSVRTIDLIRSNGVKPGIAINPEVPMTSVDSLLSLVDYVLIMTVNPGFSGQRYLSHVDQKIKELVEFRKKEHYNFEIIVDGAISPEKVAKLSKLGVEGFVLGTSALFGKKESYSDIISKLRAL